LKSGFGFDKLRPFSVPLRHIYIKYNMRC